MRWEKKKTTAINSTTPCGYTAVQPLLLRRATTTSTTTTSKPL